MPAARNYKSLPQRPVSVAAAHVASAAARAAADSDLANGTLDESDVDAARATRSRQREATGGQHATNSLSLLDSTVVLGGIAGWGRSTVGVAQHAQSLGTKSSPGFEDSPVVAAATLNGDLSIRDVSTGDILWYDSLGSKRGQIFSLQALDVTGDGVDELVACSWDGQTCIFDRAFNCAVHEFEGHVVAFRACELSVSSSGDACLEGSVGTFSGQQPCLVYATNSSISVFVMGATTVSYEGSKGRQLHSSLSLELDKEDARLADRTDVSTGRPVKYVRPPSLADALARRNPDLVDAIMRTARDMLGDSEGMTFEAVVKVLLKCRRAL